MGVMFANFKSPTYFQRSSTEALFSISPPLLRARSHSQVCQALLTLVAFLQQCQDLPYPPPMLGGRVTSLLPAWWGSWANWSISNSQEQLPSLWRATPGLCWPTSVPSRCREELTVMGMHRAGADSILWSQQEASAGGGDT